MMVKTTWFVNTQIRYLEDLFYMHSDLKSYFVYIVTNSGRTTIYIGVTNNLPARLKEHWNNKGRLQSFTGKYYCYNLIYMETYSNIQTAISREKEIKKWNRKKKEDLIRLKNPHWLFLNREVYGHWPPEDNERRF